MTGKRFVEDFQVPPDTHVRLKDFDPGIKGKHSKNHALRRIAELCAKMGNLQQKLFAERKRSLLVCLQALDAGGKDGVIKHVVGAMNPEGCDVANFKEPTQEELAHDYLWRVEAQTPKRGEIAIFNRSHYEDVLIVRVHNLVPKKVWSERYEQINAFERLHASNGTRILKFFLHISKEEQLRRFEQRLDDPAKRWKISESDYTERKYWDDYMRAYEDALSKCSTRFAPWFIIPADHKWYRNLAVSHIVLDALEKLNLKYPKPSFDLGKYKMR